MMKYVTPKCTHEGGHCWRYGGNSFCASRKCAFCGVMEKLTGQWKPE